MRRRREYTLGKRVDSMQETRRFIVEAAAEVFAERGIQATPFLEVARRAGVAPTTVSNHFANKDELAEAVVDHVIEVMDFPSPDIFGGIDSLEDRLALLIDHVYQSYQRSAPWIAMDRKEVDEVAALQDGAVKVGGIVSGLTTRALGTLAEDEEARRIVGTVLHPGFVAALVATHGGSDGAVRAAHELTMLWLNHRSAVGGGVAGQVI